MSDTERLRLFYGLLNEARVIITQQRSRGPVDPDSTLWLATVERVLRDYRVEKTKGKPS